MIPAAGLGTRISPLPCSKELFPVGYTLNSELEPIPKPVAQHLLERMQIAGISNAYVILRKGKWDIPAYFGDGYALQMNLAYLIMRKPYGTPFSVNQAYTFIKGKRVAFGFPDILFEPKDAFAELLQKQEATQTDVVLGLFKVDHPEKWDTVTLADDGSIISINPKPAAVVSPYAWVMAVWSPAFTEFMHQYLLKWEQERGEQAELSIGHVMQQALAAGLQIQSVFFENGTCLDIGTPSDLIKAIQHYANHNPQNPT
nr:sugar phosphate nucleotidyltransferase [Pontibacter vulgaris]